MIAIILQLATLSVYNINIMAEETASTPAAEDPVKGDAKPKRDFKKEQKPIEELYDLSQPIPHVSSKVLEKKEGCFEERNV